MKKRILVMTVGLVLGLSLLFTHDVFGDNDKRGEHDADVASKLRFDQHFRQLSFDIAPGASQSFALPAAQVPVRIEISWSLLNGGTQEPSEIMYAVVNQDRLSSQFTWVGTNNDGSVQVGTSNPSGSFPVIAQICGGICGGGVNNAALEVDSSQTVPGTLKLTVNPHAVILPGHFRVTMWF